MLVTPSPLTERMTLFWHNHFVSASRRCGSRVSCTAERDAARNALGNFGSCCTRSRKDPAMLIYLDSVQNRKGAPNENFAREVMELFTLGEGHYTEKDIKEAARAFTGWSLDREPAPSSSARGCTTTAPRRCSESNGHFDGDAVLDLLLARPEIATFITAKLWREFVSPDPDPAEVRADRRAVSRLAATTSRSRSRELLTSDAFYASENRGVLVKSPVEVVVGTLRAARARADSGLPFAIAAAGDGTEPHLTAERQGMAGRRRLDQYVDAARAQAVSRRVSRADDDIAPASDAPRVPTAPWRQRHERQRAARRAADTANGAATSTSPRGPASTNADGARHGRPRVRQRALDGAIPRRDRCEHGRARRSGCCWRPSPQATPDYNADSLDARARPRCTTPRIELK